jgi:hypothetical protein
MYSVKNLNILGWGLNWLDLMKEPSTAFPEKEADSAAERKHLSDAYSGKAWRASPIFPPTTLGSSKLVDAAPASPTRRLRVR